MAAQASPSPKATQPPQKQKLTEAPTNLKEAIDWVLRVTGKDGRKNTVATQPPPKPEPGPHCLCYLAKAVKDLLYDAKDPGSPGPSPRRYWDDLLLDQESDIVHPVLTDLGLLSGGSTGAASSTCAGGTEVIGTLIDQLAQGLQKWVGWKDQGDECCLKGDKGIGKKCTCSGGAGQCCSPGGPSTTTCHQCSKCGPGATASGDNKCYLSAYCKKSTASGGGGASTEGEYYWPTISSDSTKVHLLARIFLGSVCLIWSGLSQLGFLTAKGKERWETSKLHDISDLTKAGLGSFMAAMGYDLERLNGSGGQQEKKGEFVHGLLTNKDMKWNELSKGADSDSVAEYYSSIYEKAKEALKNTEEICTKYPLLVLHILASGYFRAGSAGAKGIIPAPKAATSTTSATPSSRKPRTIREILYWLSAVPYSEGYRALVERMQEKYPPKDGVPNETATEIVLHGEGAAGGASTTLKRDCITHYLMAACGYCPLVLIGIQGTIEREVKQEGGGSPKQNNPQSGGNSNGNNDNRCPEHKKNPNSKRCTLEDANKAAEAAKTTAASAAQVPAPAGSDGKLQPGQVCYGGYHLEVSKFGPLHGMYANGLFGFDMEGSPAQCLDQLRVYVYHCFYQLYFLRKQCTVGVESGAVLGWQSCRYGKGVSTTSARLWICQTKGTAGGTEHTKNCGIFDGARSKEASPLQSFLCDAIGTMVCNQTIGVDLNSQKQKYPEIDAHMNKTVDSKGIEHPAHLQYPQLCPVPMGWSKEGTSGENHFKDLKDTHKTETLKGGSGKDQKYPAHCTGNTLSYLLEYYCDPVKPHGTLVVLLRLLACITPTVPRTLGDLFGFYYYIVYIGARQSWNFAAKSVWSQLKRELQAVSLHMGSSRGDTLVGALDKFSGITSESDGHHNNDGALMRLYSTTSGQYLCPLSGQQYGQLSPAMAGTYLSWLVYLIGEFETGLKGLRDEFTKISCKDSECHKGPGGGGCGEQCKKGNHGDPDTCCCESVVSCTGVLPVLYRYGFGYGNVRELHKQSGVGAKKCHDFLKTLEDVLKGTNLTTNSKGGLHHEINKLIYTTRLPWIFVLTLAWLVAVLYLAFGAIWPLDWTHMRSHCRGLFRKGSLCPWEVLMVGKKKGRGILEFFGGK